VIIDSFYIVPSHGVYLMMLALSGSRYHLNNADIINAGCKTYSLDKFR
jgi:hypothetical protein